jgi:hypothetical protein
VMRQFVGVIARLAKSTAQQRAGGGDIPFQRSGTIVCRSADGTVLRTSSFTWSPRTRTDILEEDIWQAVHRLGLESHLGLQPPEPITRCVTTLSPNSTPSLASLNMEPDLTNTHTVCW